MKIGSKKFKTTQHILVAGSLTVAALAHAASVSNQLIVQLKPASRIDSHRNLSSSERLSALSDRSLKVGGIGSLQTVKTLRNDLHVVRYPTSMSAKAAAQALALDPAVEYAQPDYILSLFGADRASSNSHSALNTAAAFKNIFAALGEGATVIDPEIQAPPVMPNPPVLDPSFSEAWGLTKIQASAAWDIVDRSIGPKNEIIVADIDTGIDYTHEDLINNLWRNPDPTNGDVVGYDFANNDNKPYDDQGHGTHTAGTIGAVRGNGKGIAGVAPNAKLMGLKFITAKGSGTTSDAIRAIDYAVAHGARVLSNSWGGYAGDEEQPGENQGLYDAIKRAGDKNVLFVAASGNDANDNDAKPILPGGMDLPNILTVASSNEQDRMSFFSNYGLTTVDVAAPGSGIYSSIPGNKYMKNSGTSMACPHVAGLAALILAERPELTALQVKEIIMTSVDRLSAFEGKIVTGGRVNAVVALRKAKTFGL